MTQSSFASWRLGSTKLLSSAVLSLSVQGCDSCKKPPQIDVPGAGDAAGSASGGAVVALDASVPRFEGTIEVSASEKGLAPERITYRFKGDRARVDGRDKDVYIVQWLDARVTRIVTVSQKQFLEVDYAAAFADASMAADAGTPPATIQRTPQTRAFAGYACEVWEMTEGKRRAAACVTPALAAALPVSPPGGDSSSPWASALERAKVYPLFLEARDDDGKPELKSEVVRVERQALDAKLFEIPADYTRIGAQLSTLDAGLLR